GKHLVFGKRGKRERRDEIGCRRGHYHFYVCTGLDEKPNQKSGFVSGNAGSDAQQNIFAAEDRHGFMLQFRGCRGNKSCLPTTLGWPRLVAWEVARRIWKPRFALCSRKPRPGCRCKWQIRPVF